MGEQSVGYGMRKNLPAKKLINRAILRMHESGLLKKLFFKSVPHAPKCEEFQGSAYRSVSYSYVFGAFLVLGCGWVLAIGIWGIERLLDLRNNHY